MELSVEELQLISKALLQVQYLIYNDLDAICDDEYRVETEKILEHINNSIAVIDKHLYNKQDSL